MERQFTFDQFNTYLDWGLILTAKDITPPEPKTNYVELDGMSGTLDLSETLSGEITYKDRTISATFWTSDGTFKERSDLIRTIVNTLHGRKMKIYEPDDTTHYFYGRVSVKSYTNLLAYSEFKIEATCEPWRYSINDTVRSVAVNDTANDLFLHNNGVKTVVPTITVDGTVTLTYDGIRTELTSGEYKISRLKIRRGVNVIGVSGNGSVSFQYKEAEL